MALKASQRRRPCGSEPRRRRPASGSWGAPCCRRPSCRHSKSTDITKGVKVERQSRETTESQLGGPAAVQTVHETGRQTEY